jgi:LysR family glycine cleavage system transcriptional activator
MSKPRSRPLAVGPLRAFEAVARRLSFRAAAEELHLTQPAVSRQIRALEGELGAPLFSRGTRHVELTGAGNALLRAVASALDRLDATVRQIRSSAGREPVTVTTFASFASLWLIPRLHGFQALHPDIDIRISTNNRLADPDDPEVDLGLRYCHPDQAGPDAEPMFGEVLTPACAPALARSLRRTEDLAHHTLLEEDDHRPSAEFLSWRHWLERHAPAGLEPQRWVYLNFTHQQIQAALAGQGVALARVALVGEALARGELVEPFGAARRVTSPFSYWLVRWRAGHERAAVQAFEAWVLEQAALTRKGLDEPPVSIKPAAGAVR